MLLVGSYIWTNDIHGTGLVSVLEDDLDEEMQLVEGMDFFSMDDEDWGSGDYSHDHSHYHWSYSGSSVSFRDTAGSTSCLLYTSPSPRDKRQSRMPSSA